MRAPTDDDTPETHATATAPTVHVEERHWPADADEIAELARRRVPRLLMVAPDATAPIGNDCEEDWIRLPASVDDISARRATLVQRLRHHASPPRMDGHARIHYAGRWAHVESPIEGRILKALIEVFPDPRTRRQLLEIGWADQTASANALRVHISRLNRQLGTVGLRIRSLRGHGYALAEFSRPEPERRVADRSRPE